MDAIVAMGEPVPTHFLWRPQLRDPNDQMVPETAVNGRARALATFNVRDYVTAASQFGVEVLLPRELRLPRSPKEAVDRLSREDRTSINQFVATAVAEKVSALQTAKYFTDRQARADCKAFDKIMRRRGGKTPAKAMKCRRSPKGRLGKVRGRLILRPPAVTWGEQGTRQQAGGTDWRISGLFSGSVPAFDVLATDESCRTVPIQVKATRGDTWPSNTRTWVISNSTATLACRNALVPSLFRTLNLSTFA